MTGDPPQIENPPPSGVEIIGCVCFALAPMPMGVLAGPLRLFDIAQGDRSVSASPLIVFIIFSAICSIPGGVGICGGFRKGKWMARIVGLALGLILCVVQVSIILFAGLLIGLSKIH